MSSDLLPPKPPMPPGPFQLNRAGGPLAPVQQMLGQTLGGILQNAPFQMAPTIFNGTNVGPGTPFNTPAGSPAQTTSAPGMPQTFTGPGGVPVPVPPGVPFAPSATGAPTAAPTFAPPLAQPGGLLNLAGNAIESLSGAVRNLLGPAQGATPPGQAISTGPATGTPAGPGGVVSDTAAQLARNVSSALPTTPTVNPAAVQSAAAQTGLQAAPANAQALPQAPLQAPMQTPVQTTVPLQAQAQAPIATPAASSQAAPAQTQNPAANTATLAQQAPSLPAQTPTAMRADAAPTAPALPQAAADRAAAPQQAPAAVPTQAPSAPQAAPLLAAVPLAATIAQAPVAQQVAGNPQAQAVGNPLAGNAALDGGSPARAELTGTGTYTAEGPGLRRRERMRAGAQQMGQWIVAMANGRMHLVRPHDDSAQEAAKVFQWLFWVLAIVAYGCLGLVLVAFLLSFGELPSAPALRRWTGEFAFSGLLAAIGAWWLGRRLTRTPPPESDPIRR